MAAQGIFRGGTFGQLKDYQARPSGGPGAKAPGGSEVSFLKPIQMNERIENEFRNENENEFIFQKMSTFFLPKKIYFF